MRSFESFSRKNLSRGPNSIARVVISKTGGIILTKAAYSQLGSPSHIVLLYDRETRAIGIKAALPSNPDSYKLALR